MTDSGINIFIGETEIEQPQSSEVYCQVTSTEEENVTEFGSKLVGTSGSSQVELIPTNNSDTITATGTGLKRELGILSCISIVVGSIIGSGIFITPNGVLKFSESIIVSLVIWITSGVITYLGAICYLELGTMLPLSGAEYSYFLRSYGNFVAYSYSWMSIVLLKPIQVAADTQTLGTYFLQPFMVSKEYKDADKEALLVQIASTIVIIALSLSNCLSVKLAARIQILCTFAKVIAIGVIIIFGLIRIGQGNTENLATGLNPISSESQFSIGKISIALSYGLWAYDGWNTISFVTEEIKNPQKNLPRGILFGIPFVVIMYVMANVAYLTALSPIRIINSAAVAVEWSHVVFGEIFDGVQIMEQVYPFIIPMFVAFSCFGSANGTIFTSGRLIFTASRQGHFMEMFSYIHLKTLTPAPAILLIMLLSIFINFSFDISVLIKMSSVISWFFYGLAFGVVIVLRIRESDLVRPIKVWIVIPVLMIIVCAFLVLSPIIEEPQFYYLYIFIVYAIGVIFYYVCVHKKININWLTNMNSILRKSFKLAPPQHTAY